MSYVNYYELMYMIHMGDEWALKQFIMQFQPYTNHLVNNMMRKYWKYAIIREDLMQEASIAVFDGIKSYRDTIAILPQAYFTIIVKRRLIHYIHQNARLSPIHMYNFISLDMNINESESVYDVTPRNNDMGNPVYYMNYKRLEESVNHMTNQLPSEQKDTLNMWLADVSYKEASASLGITYKAYDGRLQRMKRKVSQFVMKQ